MKKVLIMLVFITPMFAFSQGKNISFAKKIKEPFVTSTNDTIKVEQQIKVSLGSNADGSYKYVQMLNSFGEPVGKADSRAAMKKQEIKFFKQQDGTMYAFTKYFVINIEAALLSKEITLN